MAIRALRPMPVNEATRVAEDNFATGPVYEGLSAEALPDAALLGALAVLVAVLFFSAKIWGLYEKVGDGRGVGSCLYFENMVLLALECRDELGVELAEPLNGLGRLLVEVMPRLMEVNIEVVPTELEDDGVGGRGVELDDIGAELLNEKGDEELGAGVVVVVLIGVVVVRRVDVGVNVGIDLDVGPGVVVGVSASVDEGVLLGRGGEAKGDDFGESDLELFPLSGPFFPPSKTTKLALEPLGTVTTQKAAPPTPTVAAPSISLTLCFKGSIAQGSPLQCPSHTISTPHVGILSRNGVVGSRYIGFQASLMKVSPFLSVLAPAT